MNVLRTKRSSHLNVEPPRVSSLYLAGADPGFGQGGGASF